MTHVKEARNFHKITAAVLYALLQDAYANDFSFDETDFSSWVQKKMEIPVFRFWLTVLNLEVLLLSCVRSVRQGDFDLFKLTLSKMLP